MSSENPRWKTTLLWTWHQTSALVALLLIIAALLLGIRIGSGGPSSDEPAAAVDTGAAQDTTPKLYTCSMHPQVRLPDPDAKCPICFMDLIAVSEGAGGEGSERRLALTDAAVKLAQLDTTVVGRFFPTATVRLFGKITFDQTRISRITSYFSGRLDRLHIDYVGTAVRKGDHVAEIYSPNLLAAFEEVRQARLALDETMSSSKLVRSTTEHTLTAAREKLRLFGLTPDQIDAAERGTMSEDVFTIYSPTGGIVTHLAALEGDYVETGSPIAVVADLGHLWLDLEAYESQLPLVRWGQTVTFTIESHPGEVFEGKISFIEPMIDARTRSAAVRVAVDNAAGRLKPGMFATAVVSSKVSAAGSVLADSLAGKWVSPMHPEIVKDGPGSCDVCGMDLVPAEELGLVDDTTLTERPLVVPKTAVLVTGKRAVAYVQLPDTEKPTFEGREVVLGPRAGDFYIVRSGLDEGDRVVTNGLFKIDSAMQILAKPSMMQAGRPGSGAMNAKPHRHDHAGMGAGASSSSLPDHFHAGVDAVYDSYFAVQEALSGDDFAATTRALTALGAAVRAVDTVGVVGEPLGEWRRAAARLTTTDTPPDIATARVAFESMAGAAIDLVRLVGHRRSETLRVAFCPMAFDDRGAEWLQRRAEIDNPYFGAEMLRCGLFRDEFPPMNHEEPDDE